MNNLAPFFVMEGNAVQAVAKLQDSWVVVAFKLQQSPLTGEAVELRGRKKEWADQLQQHLASPLFADFVARLCKPYGELRQCWVRADSLIVWLDAEEEVVDWIVEDFMDRFERRSGLKIQIPRFTLREKARNLARRARGNVDPEGVKFWAELAADLALPGFGGHVVDRAVALFRFVRGVD